MRELLEGKAEHKLKMRSGRLRRDWQLSYTPLGRIRFLSLTMLFIGLIKCLSGMYIFHSDSDRSIHFRPSLPQVLHGCHYERTAMTRAYLLLSQLAQLHQPGRTTYKSCLASL